MRKPVLITGIFNGFGLMQVSRHALHEMIDYGHISHLARNSPVYTTSKHAIVSFYPRLA